VTSGQGGQDYTATFVGGVDDIYEENDTFATARTITPGTYTNLVWNDEDWFKILVPVEDDGKDLKIRVKGIAAPSASPANDFDFRVMDGSGKLLGIVFSSTDDETLYISRLTPGWYYIGQYYNSAVGGVYSLTVEIGDAFGIGYVSGRVMDTQGHGLENVTIELQQEVSDWGKSWPCVTTDANGDFKAGYAPGRYRILYNSNTLVAYSMPWVVNANYAGMNSEDLVTLTAGQTLTGQDARLDQAGAITGRVTDPNGNPLGSLGAYVHVFDGNNRVVGSCYSGPDGTYLLSHLLPGNYKVRIRPTLNLNDLSYEWYSNASTVEDALPVPVQAGATTPNIDAQVENWADVEGYIEGHLADAAGNPVNDIVVTAYDSAGFAVASAGTGWNNEGYYRIRRLRTGQYRVFFNAGGTSRVSEYYPDKATLADAVPVTVQTGQTVSGIDARLDEAGAIAGRVTDASGDGIYNVNVFVTAVGSDRSFSATTNAAGNYTVGNILPGTYRVRFRPAGGDLAAEWYNDKSSFTLANDVVVAAGETVPDVNAQLTAVGGSITGQVTNGTDGLKRVLVYAYDSAKPNAAATTSLTREDGTYTLKRLPEGDVKVFFNSDYYLLGYGSEYYNDQAAHAAANPVPINLGQTTDNINAVLAPIPSLTILTGSLPAGLQFTPYEADLQAEGGRLFYFWDLAPGSDPLPAGLALNPNGRIIGIPLATGTYNLIVRLTDSTRPQQSDTQALTLNIGAYPGTGYMISGDIRIGSSGGPPLAGVVLEGLPGPPATNLQGSYATIVPAGYSGMARPFLAGYGFDPETDGYTDINANRPDQDYVAYKVTLDVATDWLPNGTEGQAYNEILVATGGTSPYTWALYSGILPDGLALAPDGTLSGTPLKTGTYEFTLRVTDSSGHAQRIYQTYSVTINSGSLISADPILIWKLNEGSGTTAIDSSGNNLNGILRNAVSYTTDCVGGWGFAAETAVDGWIEQFWGDNRNFYFANEATIMAYVKIADFDAPRRFIWKIQYSRPNVGWPYTIEIRFDIEGYKLVLHSTNRLFSGSLEEPDFRTEIDDPLLGQYRNYEFPVKT